MAIVTWMQPRASNEQKAILALFLSEPVTPPNSHHGRPQIQHKAPTMAIESMCLLGASLLPRRDRTTMRIRRTSPALIAQTRTKFNRSTHLAARLQLPQS